MSDTSNTVPSQPLEVGDTRVIDGVEMELVWTDSLTHEFVGVRESNPDGMTLRFSDFYQKDGDYKIPCDLGVMARMLLELAAERGEAVDEETAERIKARVEETRRRQ